jgi:hypothetical protein
VDVVERIRDGLVALCLLASVVACNGSGSGSDLVVPEPRVSSTTTIAVAPTYRPANPGPVTAVELFLTAEIAGEFEASFEMLSQADQESAGGVEGWIAEHYLVVPTIRGFRFTADSADGTRAEISADLSLEPDLDQVVGLTPEKAASTWVLFEEAGDWKVAFEESRIEPVYLDDEGAPAAVEEWAVRRQNCEPTTEWDASLLGFPSLAEAMCGSEGPVEAGEAVPLADAAESEPFLAAFGPEVGLWARVVPIDGEHPLRAVVAPIGDEWVVIGVLDA